MRKLVTIAVVVRGTLALVGLMHTPFARSLFGASCPFETVERSPEERDEARREAARLLSGEGSAPTRVAGGFELGVATRDDLSRWGATTDGAATRSEAVCVAKVTTKRWPPSSTLANG